MNYSRNKTSDGTLITIEDIQFITGLDEDAAEREHKYIRNYLGTKSDDLLVSQYCNFFQLNQNEMKDFTEVHKSEDFTYSDNYDLNDDTELKMYLD